MCAVHRAHGSSLWQRTQGSKHTDFVCAFDGCIVVLQLVCSYNHIQTSRLVPFDMPPEWKWHALGVKAEAIYGKFPFLIPSGTGDHVFGTVMRWYGMVAQHLSWGAIA